jgi:primosomal protein N' (replication factor Y)
VEVPFRNNTEFGLVFSLSQQETFSLKTKLRPLVKICFLKPFLPLPVFSFFKEISDFYSTDLGFVYKFSLPKFTKKFFKELSIVDLGDSFLTKKSLKPQIMIAESPVEIKNILHKNISPKGQHLILVPEKNDLSETVSWLEEKFSVHVFSSDLTEKQTNSLWKKIRKDENAIIIGTRKALFLPWTNLKNIFLLDEGNENYKSWDMAPRYHARDATMLLSKFTGSQVFLLSHTPSINSYYLASENKYSSTGILTNFNRSFNIVDLNLEKHAKNYSFLSFILLDELRNLEKNDCAFLYLNKKGSAGYVFCEDCQKPITCKNCKRPLNYFSSKKEMRCNFCEISEPLAIACPNCKSLNLQMRNPGTESIEKELRKFPEFKDFKIAVIDSENFNLEKQKNFEDGTIFIGTELAWNIIPWSKIKLIAFLDTDRALLSSEYKDLENLWQKIRTSFFKSNTESKIILQGTHLDHYIFNALHNPQIFYEQQLSERRMFHYPPYNFWLKLIISDKNANQAVKQANELKNRLIPLTNTYLSAKISGPHQAVPQYKKGAYYYIILIRLGYENYQNAVKQINKVVPQNWKVDPNPNTLLSL